MSKIKVVRLSEQEINEKGIRQWPIWEKEISEFPWYYDTTEHCYILDGEVVVETAEGETRFGKGDFVTFPAGLSCRWRIIKPVRKHYSFD
ncbi:MAG TPA: cupin domain-containing protein [Salinivirgaceae bacterium]|nr:cupin domain-containing protein [Salinivirgaceae bacterium]